MGLGSKQLLGNLWSICASKRIVTSVSLSYFKLFFFCFCPVIITFNLAITVIFHFLFLSVFFPFVSLLLAQRPTRWKGSGGPICSRCLCRSSSPASTRYSRFGSFCARGACMWMSVNTSGQRASEQEITIITLISHELWIMFKISRHFWSGLLSSYVLWPLAAFCEQSV